MIKVATGEIMQSIDRKAIEKYKIPEILLMEEASRQVCDVIINEFSDREKIGIICGAGNNGGDGIALARRLWMYNKKPEIYLVAPENKLKDLPRTYLTIAKNLNIPVFNISTPNDFNKYKNYIKEKEIIVEAMLGTGSKPPLRGIYNEVVSFLNTLNCIKISIDIPAGLSADNYKIEGKIFKADYTVTFGLPKISQVFFPSRKYTGKLKIVNIGFPEELLQNNESNYYLVTKEGIKRLLPWREPDNHKGKYGHAVIFAGSTGKTGAAILASNAALAAGCGLVTTICDKKINNILENNLIEVMTQPVDLDNPDVAFKNISQLLRKADVIACGCGIGTEEKVKKFLSLLLSLEEKVFILDADALNIVAENIDLINNSKSRFILTPHIGEMARLVKTKTNEIIENRLTIGKEFARKYGVILVLKSAETTIFTPDEKVYISNNGVEGMATAGSGDVLTGIITGFVTQIVKQNRKILDGVIAGVYLHGLAGTLAQRKHTSFSLTAGKIIDFLGDAIKLVKNE